jgi:acyl-CoA synthetase (AMP-forming)/AMP-acid ligase II
VLVSNPLQPAFNELVYRTGDLVRLEADGCYRFIGRRDHMIKSRGYRIELGEIERALHDHPGVKEAVVLAVPDDEIGARLLAVVVPHTDGSLDPKQLQAFCLVRLPKYMVPEEMEFRQELPRTSTGKADRMALMTTLGTTVEEARRT